MRSRLVIVGAGGFGRELLSGITSSPRFLERYGVEEIVYVDDILPPIPVRRPIIGTIADYAPASDDVVLLAIGSPRTRRELVQTLRARGSRFGTFVHDRAHIGDGVALGEGVVVCADARITADVTLGEFVQVNVNCSIGHDVVVGDFTTFSPSCDLTGGVAIGADVFFGTAAKVAPKKRIGNGASIGIGSVVVRSVKAGSTVFGNPARVIGSRE